MHFIPLYQINRVLTKFKPMNPANEMTNQITEITVTYHNKIKPSARMKITSSKNAYDLLINNWSDNIEYVEEFYIILLNKANKVLGISKISEGSMSSCLVDPKRVYQVALKSNAASLILSHNHPSGSLLPSESDQKITRKIKEAGMLLEINVLDHLIH